MKTIIYDNQTYHLNQCENVLDWLVNSKVGEYTRYYDKTILHTANGYYAAYSDNMTNGVFI